MWPLKFLDVKELRPPFTKFGLFFRFSSRESIAKHVSLHLNQFTLPDSSLPTPKPKSLRIEALSMQPASVPEDITKDVQTLYDEVISSKATLPQWCI